MNKRVCSAIGMVAAFAVAAAAQTYLYNGSFSQCMEPCGEFGSPTNWGIEGMPSTMGVWRNTTDFQSAPACLSVQSVGDSGGHFTQRLENLPATPGGSFPYEFWVKTDAADGGAFQVVAHFAKGVYWEECSPSGWRTLHMGNAVTSGWTQITGTTTVPADANKCIFRIWLQGGNITFNVDGIVLNNQSEVVGISPVQSGVRASEPFSINGTTIRISRDNAYSLRVIAADGRQVMGSKGFGSNVDLSSLSSGAYIVNLVAPGLGVYRTGMTVVR